MGCVPDFPSPPRPDADADWAWPAAEPAGAGSAIDQLPALDVGALRDTAARIVRVPGGHGPGFGRVAAFLPHRGGVAASRGHDRVAVLLWSLLQLEAHRSAKKRSADRSPDRSPDRSVPSPIASPRPAPGSRRTIVPPTTIFPLSSYKKEPFFVAMLRGSFARFVSGGVARGTPSAADECRAARLFLRRLSLPPYASSVGSASVPPKKQSPPRPAPSSSPWDLKFRACTPRPARPASLLPSPSALRLLPAAAAKRPRAPTPTNEPPHEPPAKRTRTPPAIATSALDALAAVSLIASRLDPAASGARTPAPLPDPPALTDVPQGSALVVVPPAGRSNSRSPASAPALAASIVAITEASLPQ
eukprot:tig00020538_g10335.t1